MAGRRILVVDDESSIVFTISRILLRAGYQVLTAENGLEAKMIIMQQRMKSSVELLLLDMRMPEMNGSDLMDELMSCGICPKLLPMSGALSTSLHDFLAARNCTVFLEKPFTPDQLIDAVERAFHVGETQSDLAKVQALKVG